MKGRLKRIVSGMLAAVTLMSTAIQPMAVNAAEPEETKPPLYEEVKEYLDADEVVTARDYEMEVGHPFDVAADFSGIEIPDSQKVKITFEKAANEQGEAFDSSHADTYKAVYYVEPQTPNHPKYQISRSLVVKEPATEAQTAKADSMDAGGQGSGETDESESEDGESETQPETVAETVTEAVMEPVTETEAADPQETEAADLKETEKKKLYEMSCEEVMDAGKKLVSDAMASGDAESSFTGEDLELYLAYQNLLSAGSNGGIQLLAEEGSLVVKNAKDESGMWDIPLLNYIYSTETGNQVNNYVKYIANDSANNWRLAYCLQISKHFIDSTQYIGKKWQANGMYAEISYAITNGCKHHGDKNNAAYSTGNWIKDYYVTQTVLYCVLKDYGYDGHSLGSLRAVSGYQDVYDCVQAMYKDVKKNGNKAEDGYGDAPVYEIVEPSSTAMKLNSDASYYQTDWYSVKSSGDLVSRVIQLSGAPAGTEIVYKDSASNTSKFYIRIPAEKAYAIEDQKASFKVKATAKFSRPFTYIYESLIADAQNITFLEKKTTNAPQSSEANVSLKLDKAKVAVVKVDSAKSDAKLAGAVFGLYKDKDCTQLITKLPKTDANGAAEAEIVKTQETVYLKEITAPTGYRINSTAYNVKLAANNTTSVTVPDEEQFGELTVYKEGEVLTGADVNENGVTFRYEARRQKGAVYDVFAGADIYTAYGAQVYKKGELVKEHLTTDDSGAVTIKKLHLGTYVVKEVQAPENFYNAKEEKTVTLSYGGQNVEVVFSETTFTNDRQKAEVSVVKQDKDTGNPLEDGIFGLYAGTDIVSADGTVIVKKDALIEKAATGEDGKAAFHADLPVGFSYDVKEEQAPEGYLRNEKDVYSFKFSYTSDSEAKVAFAHTFSNERVSAKISLQKKDAETNQTKPQGDASLEGAVYGLYARTNIVHPDGKTGVLYKAGEQVAAMTTNQDGASFAANLFLGTYFVKEITPPVGYLADETEYDLTCNYEGDLTAVVERSCVSPEQVKKQPFQIIKAANNGNTDAQLLSGVGFTAYLVSSLGTNEDGSYDFVSAKPVVIGANGETEMFTDERGYACSIALPYGTYVVRETTTPHNYKPVDDFIVRITEHFPNTPQVWRVLLDDEFEAKLKIVKQDDETKKPVLAKNTEFKVYDLDHKKYVEQVTTYPTIVTHKSYFTDEKGYLILPQNLKIGHYRIEEVTAPFGYTINENYYEVTVDSNTAYLMDSVSGDAVIEVVYENHPVKGRLLIKKQGEVLDGYKDDFTYHVENLKGAVFEVYAAEDIYTADFQKDSSGKRTLEYAAGTLVDTLTTNEAGEAERSNLPLGTYKVAEVAAPEGFVLNETAQTVTFAYADQNTPVIEQTALFENERQKVEISVVKQDAKTKAGVSGAVFGLYAKEDILAHGNVIVKADTLLGKAESEKDGKAVFVSDVPFGSFYIRELSAPAGYVSSDKELAVTAEYQGQDVHVVELSSVFENEPTKISVKKTDITTGVELEGATLTVLDKDGNVIDTWKSVKGEEHLIERLTVGETYILREEMAPYGYLKAEEIKFTVEDTAETQKVEMTDDVPIGQLIIDKKGEFLDKISVMDTVGGWIAHLFEYVSGSLKDVTFEVYAQEDVKAADGESADYYKKDELVGTITTDDTGYAKLENLPLGKYYVKEKETAEGYVLDGEIREIDLTYRDQDTPVVTFSADWQNKRQKAEVSVLKKEKDSDRVLEGAVFALCSKDDILGADGNVLMKADTIIEEKATDKEGKLMFMADLPIGYTYYVKETAPAPGFATAAEAQEFIFQYQGADKERVTYSFTFENVPTVFEFTKTSLTDGKEVEGAKIQITDETGAIVDEWVSGKEPHIIKELTAGKIYTMTETKPADGYVTAESIAFTVEDTGEVQKVEMKDDVTKVEISKTDIAGKELPGAKLTILNETGKVVESWTSGKEPHYIEMLPIGKYTLHEEVAPDGFLVAEDVAFEVKDTADIQKVQMKDEAKTVEEVPKDTPKDTPKADTPKTGDNRPIGMLLVLLLLGAAGAGASAWYLKRKK